MQNARRTQNDDSSFFSGSVISGLFMMLVAVVWFVGGLACGVIFFYPPVLFVLGMLSFVKGLMFDD